MLLRHYETKVWILYPDTCKGFKSLNSNSSLQAYDFKSLSHLVKMGQASKLLTCF